MISVERTTRNRHFLRGSNGAIGSTTTRTRTIIEFITGDTVSHVGIFDPAL
jgi:hypothetical protein